MSAAKKGGDLTPAVFTYGDTQQVRMLVIKDQPWFMAKDICSVLGISNHKSAIAALDDDERLGSVVSTSGQRRKMQFVSESGLYNLIFRSRKAEAKAFRRWVTSEVLPSIRRTGSYTKPKAAATIERPGIIGRLRDYWDVRHLPFDRVQLFAGEVRLIVLHGRAWYSMPDVLVCLGTRSAAMDIARKLPTGHRHLLWLFGSTQKSWFVDDIGLRMVMAARGHRIGQLKLDILSQS